MVTSKSCDAMKQAAVASSYSRLILVKQALAHRLTPVSRSPLYDAFICTHVHILAHDQPQVASSAPAPNSESLAGTQWSHATHTHIQFIITMNTHRVCLWFGDSTHMQCRPWITQPVTDWNMYKYFINTQQACNWCTSYETHMIEELPACTLGIRHIVRTGQARQVSLGLVLPR